MGRWAFTRDGEIISFTRDGKMGFHKRWGDNKLHKRWGRWALGGRLPWERWEVFFFFGCEGENGGLGWEGIGFLILG